MNETAGTAARAWINPTESEQGAVTQIRRPSFRLISGLEYTGKAASYVASADLPSSNIPPIIACLCEATSQYDDANHS